MTESTSEVFNVAPSVVTAEPEAATGPTGATVETPTPATVDPVEARLETIEHLLTVISPVAAAYYDNH